jgi:ribosomal-protein-alanine N-acetyltransferase
MTFDLRPMNQVEAEEIAGWKYPPPYSFYNATEDELFDLDQLLSATQRRGRYYSVFSGEEHVGFFEFRMDGEEVVIGLGLRPDLCGHGWGRGFVEAGMAFASERFQTDQFALWVAAFNQRAIRVYERVGFGFVRQIDQETNGAVHRFIEMRHPA